MEQGDTEPLPEDESPQQDTDITICHQVDMVTGKSTPPEDIAFISDQTIEKLTHGLLGHYLPDLQDSKQALQELTQNQVILLDTLDQEITKFKECNSLLDLNSLFTEAKIYHTKLVNIRKEMMILHDKTTKLKKRALKLQQQRQKEALEKEQQREKEMERERQLIAKPAKERRDSWLTTLFTGHLHRADQLTTVLKDYHSSMAKVQKPNICLIE